MGDSERLRVVLFRLGPHLAAAVATAVREVIPSVPATRVPGADRTVAGLLNLRGTLLTVVDGRRAVGLADSEDRGDSVLVVDRGDRTVGLVVDEVLDLVDVVTSELEAGRQLPGIYPGLVRAVGRHAGQVFTLLDTDRLLAPAVG